jgi:hypothetical protein
MLDLVAIDYYSYIWRLKEKNQLKQKKISQKFANETIERKGAR